MAKLIDDLSDAIAALDFQRVLSEQISVKNNLSESGAQNERVELEFVPKIGRGEHGRVVFVVRISANSPSLGINIGVSAIYSHDPGLEFSDRVLWEFFVYCALPVLTTSLMRIQDAIIPLMFAQFDFLPPLADLKDELLARVAKG